MENASKALLIAGEVFIAMLVASMFVLLFSTMSEYSRSYELEKQVEEIQAFNSQFLQYTEDATLQDIVTVTKMAQSWNTENNYMDGDENYITISLSGTILTDIEDTDVREILNAENYGIDSTPPTPHVQRYHAIEIRYSRIGRVNTISYERD